MHERRVFCAAPIIRGIEGQEDTVKRFAATDVHFWRLPRAFLSTRFHRIRARDAANAQAQFAPLG
ncbi:hypothetical protein [Alteromonas mediterranea]|uniref:hypothetical protein n=1 Tax=Alteromonas mediterranea TaxID=314275 RepID=UPI003AAECA99